MKPVLEGFSEEDKESASWLLGVPSLYAGSIYIFFPIFLSTSFL